ncbi:succinate dehydrogenase, cytochrome b556 subunit [Verticiella sediminum]|uniref:Succinate dehydrogenase cytochrome b556 subunit n=1 Tax=Verticiella sediminum TaxID=1247510 RepID=A0A556ACL0_9BURK|nr:succinate dehydrogenase, cytochrome b556 subunit [Verticiella sediminum]TSH90603.1 succinate dehydrogenase, cytochrome b556 subunit [Verticiella sediminum]
MSETTQASQATRPRKEFRNISVPQILSYRLPLAGRLSILHRVSGALLFLALPIVLLPLFQLSVASPESFEQFRSFAAHPLSKLVFLVLIWAYLHHFCAGIRYLLLDLHIGMSKESGKRSAGIVFAVSLVLTAVFALKLFGAF